MRFMLKISIPVSEGNKAIKEDRLTQTIQSILAELRPEAVYFTAAGGTRTVFIVLNMSETSEMTRIAEPWFLAFNASVESYPVMLPEDLVKGAHSIEEAARKYA